MELMRCKHAKISSQMHTNFETTKTKKEIKI